MESLPDAALCLPCPQPLPDSPSHRHFRWQLLPDAVEAASAGASPAQQLPHGGNPRSGNLFRTDCRFAPSSRSASLAGPSILEGMDAHGLCGRVPDSAGNVSPRIASAQTDANLSAHLHRLLTPPPYLRQMRLSPSRGRRCCVQDEAAAWPGGRCCVQDEAFAWPGAAFLQITARTNPCSRHLWGTLARAVASICAHRAR